METKEVKVTEKKTNAKETVIYPIKLIVSDEPLKPVDLRIVEAEPKTPELKPKECEIETMKKLDEDGFSL